MSSCKLLFFLAVAALAGSPHVFAEPDNLLANGGFENGSEGWLYHQWEGKLMPGAFDKQMKMDGAQSFKFTTPDSPAARYICIEKKGVDPATDYILEFWLKTEGMWPDSVRARLEIVGSGWLGSQQGVENLVETGGTQDWKKYMFAVSAARLGKLDHIKFYVYNDHPDKGALWIDGVAFREGAAAEVPTGAGAVKLSGDTSKPVHSTYVLGEKPTVNFSVGGLRPGEAQTLELNIVDEHDVTIEKKSIPFIADENGAWQSMGIATPGEKLGFYRVRASLGNGALLARVGSREKGFLTYAVVPDPKTRQKFPAGETMFGMQGGFGPWGNAVLELLGASWVLDGEFEWIRQEREPGQAGNFTAANYNKVATPPKWPQYPLPTLFMAPPWAVVPETHAYNTGKLTPEGEKAWDAYAREAAKAFMKKWPGFAPRYYQITWEPIQPWGFKGKDEDLVRIYEIAYAAIHAVDPDGLVAGPCRGVDKGEVQRLEDLLKLGLGKYLDAYSTHPYWTSASPEAEGMHDRLAAIRQLLKKYCGRDIPMIGTEQGLSTHEDPAQDIVQARSLIRQNLITLGEGYQFNMAFYIVDYLLSGQKGYGYYYVPVDGVPWGPAKINPRPIVPAYAAQSLLIEGHKTLGRIDGLGATSLGYAFKRGDDVVLALWDYGEGTQKIELPVGKNEVERFDWMGNTTTLKPPRGGAEVDLCHEPVYLRGVSPSLWGDDKSKRLKLPKKEIDFVDGDAAELVVNVTASATIRGTIVVEPDTRLNIAPIRARANGGSNKIKIPIPANAKAGKYPVRVTLVEDEVVVGYEGATLNIRPPVDITRVSGINAKSLGVTFRNAAQIKHSGAVVVTLKKILKGEPRPDLPMIDLPDGKVQLVDVDSGMAVGHFTLDAEKMATLMLTFDDAAIDPYAAYLAQVVIKTQNARSAERAETVGFAVLSRPKTPVKIDGDLSEWEDVPASFVSGLSSVIRQPKLYKGADDLSAKIRMQWDEKNLYLALRVTDDVFCAEDSGEMMWRNDCVQLAIDVADRAAGEPAKNTETNIGLTPEGPQAFRAISFDSEKVPLGLLQNPAIDLAVKRVPGGIVYEAAYAWQSLGLATPPKAGRRIAVALAINDRDSKEQTDPKALGIFGGIFPTKDRDAYGVFLLGE